MSTNQPKSSRSKPNYLYSIISMALVLFLLGLFGMFVLHSQGIVKYYKENIEVMVELKDNTAEQDKFQFQKKLEGTEYAKSGSVKYVSKEDGAKIMENYFGDDFTEVGINNPFLDVIEFNVKADYVTDEEMEKISSEIKEQSFVEEVTYQKVLVSSIASNVRKLTIVVFLVGIFFIIIAVTLINNTVKLSLYSNRFIIKNMQLVGATFKFISRPYIQKGIINGFLSGAIAVITLILITFIAQQQFPDLLVFRNPLGYGLMITLLILLGIVISGVSTFQSVKKYLYMRLDDLY